MLLEKGIVLLNLLYLVLITREIKWGWLCGIVGSGLFVWSNLEQHLYMDSILNSYYVLAGGYGWYSWNKTADSPILKVSHIPIASFLMLLVSSLSIAALLGFFFATYTNNSLPYLDATVTMLSFLATWMTAKKYIETWYLWLVADGLAIYLFYQKHTPEYVVLYVVYTILVVYAYWNWRKEMTKA